MEETVRRYTPEDHQSIRTVGFAVSRGTIRENFQRHRHAFGEIAVIVGGRAVHLLGGERYPLEKGDFFAVKGDTVHGFAEVEELDILNLMYDPGIFREEARPLRGIPGFLPLVLTEPALRSGGNYRAPRKLDERALAEVCDMAEILRRQTENGTEAVTLRLGFFALVSFLSARYHPEEEERRDMRALSDALEYLEEHYPEIITLKDISDSMHLSGRQAQRIFLRTCGKTPMEYLRELRLGKAALLLSDEKAGVTEVAGRCGFSDPAYFTRLFRRKYGMTPSEAKGNASTDGKTEIQGTQREVTT